MVFHDKDALIIPVDEITKVELFYYNEGQSTLAGVSLFLLGAPFVSFLFLMMMSCPFVCVNHDGTYRFAGEIFSGAVFPCEERDDFLRLPSMTVENGEYHLKISNQIRTEIQHINLAQLMIIDYPPNTQALVDKYGRPQVLIDPKPPLGAFSGQSPDLCPLIKAGDDAPYVSQIRSTGELLDTVYCAFNRPAGTPKAKLVLRARNTFWLDYTFKESFYLMGDYYQSWYRQRMKQQPGEDNWPEEQHIPLAVYARNGDCWQYLDSFNVAGPMAFRDDVLELDLSGGNDCPVQKNTWTGFQSI